MLTRVPFHDKRIEIHKLADMYKTSVDEIRFRYRHGCRNDNLVVKHINKESPYSFITFNNKEMTRKELMTEYPHLDISKIHKKHEK